MPQTNACQLVLKYMLMNKKTFTKAYHDRLYYFSSGSKFMEVSGRLNKWMDERNKERNTFLQDPVPNTRAPMRPELLMKRSVLYVIYEFTSTSFTPHVYVIYTIRLRQLKFSPVIICITQQVDRHQRVVRRSGGRDHILYGGKANPVWDFGTQIQKTLLAGESVQTGADLCLPYAVHVGTQVSKTVEEFQDVRFEVQHSLFQTVDSKRWPNLSSE